uniref:Uncharacterized protein ycf23 n=1 Tax=Dicranema revolutum TaxID=239144 RepID=A0A4D6WRX9_9FLOR|nr:hypothetical protein [Dicranema revolutum]
MNMFYTNMSQKFLKRQAIKVITGLSNFNINNVMHKVKAAEMAGATYIDIAAHPDLVSIVKYNTYLNVCVSSINPMDLYRCVLVGADMVEIGNFDLFYNKDIAFSSSQILRVAQETKYLLNSTNICVTIPHHLYIEDQIKLVANLEKIGIDCIQTEGFNTKNQIFDRNKSFVFKSIYKSSSALSSSYVLSKVLNISIIAASGINILSAPIAISCGASAVAIGSTLDGLSSTYIVINYIKDLAEVINDQHYYISSKKHLTLRKCKNIGSYNNFLIHESNRID